MFALIIVMFTKIWGGATSTTKLLSVCCLKQDV